MFERIVLLLSILGLFSACTRDVETKVSISIPENISAKTLVPESSSLNAHNSISSLGTEAFSNGAVFDVSEVNCYMLLVEDPERSSGNTVCKDNRGTERRFLRAIPGISATGSDQKVEIKLSSSTKRKIYLMGMNSTVGNCVPVREKLTAPNYWSKPRLLVSESVTLEGEEQRLVMQLPSGDVSGKLELEGCYFESGGGDIPQQADLESSFGTGRDGVLTITSQSFIDLSIEQKIVDGQNMYLSKSFNVNAVESLDGKRIKASMDFEATTGHLIPNDLVLFHIPAANSSGVEGPDGACGIDMYRGKYSYARVTGISGDIVSLDRPMLDKNIYTAIGRNQLNIRLSNAPQVNQNFCKITMQRVPEFESIVFQPSSAAARLIKPAAFNPTNFTGGILAFKVKKEILIDDTSTGGDLYNRFDVSAKGFIGGTANHTGAGIQGIPIDQSQIGNGGTGVASGNAGGGSNAGLGNDSDTSALAGIPTGLQVGGTNGVVIPGRDRKLFFGGQGGASAASPGGAGGGIILAQIHRVNLNATQSGLSSLLEFNAAGGSSGGQQGAGAGGTIFVSVKEVINNTYGQNEIKLYAKGGDGTGGSGAGGAGMLELQYCNNSDVEDGTGLWTLLESATLGISGGGGEPIPNTAPSYFGGAGGGFTLSTSDPKPFYCYN